MILYLYIYFYNLFHWCSRVQNCQLLFYGEKCESVPFEIFSSHNIKKHITYMILDTRTFDEIG